MSHRRIGPTGLLFLLAFTAVLVAPPPGAFAQDAELSAEEKRAQRAIVRFVEILESNPRFGVALDRVYGHHVERGTIDALTQSYRDRLEQNPADGTAWMVLGMIEFHRGRDSEAVQAFRDAEQHRADDPLAPYYLGRALVLIGQPDGAVEAFERAIVREPERTDLLEIYQALGRVHQRAHHNEEALAVWDRLEKSFPDDLRVQEEIAKTLSEEGDYEGALARYKKLAERTDDRYQQVQFSLRADGLRLKLGQTDAAIADMEQLLADLRPESWLYRDVRQRIEEVFLRTDDYAGLAVYYERWLERNPDDVDAMARLGEALAVQGRMPEAQQWYAKAIERAPSSISLRLAYIEQLTAERKFGEAVSQYEQLEEIDPGNPDHIAEWGRLIAEDRSLPEEDRHAQASGVWKKLLEAYPDDPVIVTQVADLHRHAELNEEAIALYQQTIALAPADPQYREYLGEFYHRLKRPDDAKATWRAIAEGDNRTTRNLVRLAEVFAGFGYGADAIETMREACDGDPGFADRLRFAEMLREEGVVDDALTQLDTAAPLAETLEERQVVLRERIKCYQASGRLAGEIQTLASELAGDQDVTAPRWQKLALFYEADRNLEQATASVRRALKLDESSVAVWTTAARIFEASGQLGDAADANAKLTEIDRRYRTEYLTEIARLRLRLGQGDEAIRTAADLIAAAPGNPEHYQFYADVCFRLGRADEGLEALRRSVAVNPADEAVLLALAGALSDQFRSDEAIELYWRAFEKSPDLDSQISVVTRLADLYLRTNHFDRLITRLETMAREFDRQRDMAICLANAHSAAGDLGSARMTLESLINEDSRDVQLLTQLVRLSEMEEDYETAVRYQRRVNELAPSSEGTVRLANLLMQTGDADEAELTWIRIVEEAAEPHRVYHSIDRLLRAGKHEVARAMTDRLLRDSPRDWEALFRSAVSLWHLDDHAGAAERCRAVLALSEADDALSAQAAHQLKQKQTSGARLVTSRLNQYPDVLQRTSAASQVQRALGLYPERYGRVVASTWAPQTFGQARVASLVVVLADANEEEDKAEQVIDVYRQAAQLENASQRDLWDWYYVLAARQYSGGDTSDVPGEMYATARRLAEGLDPGACALYLSMAANRSAYVASSAASSADVAESDEAPQMEPLADEELEHLLKCFDVVRSQADVWQAYSAVRFLQTIIGELTLAGRTGQADAFYEKVLGSVSSEVDLQAAVAIAVGRGELDRVLQLAGQLEQRRLASGKASRQPPGNYREDVLNSLAQLMAQRSAAGEHTDVLRILDVTIEILNNRLINRPPSRARRSTTWNQGAVAIPIYVAGAIGAAGSPTAMMSSSGIVYSYNRNQVQLDYPQPNEYFDYGGLIALRNAYEAYNREDILIDLVRHLEAASADGDSGSALFGRLALVYIYWWHDLKDDAAAQLDGVVEDDSAGMPLRLELGLMLHQQGETARALAVIDAAEPLNHVMLQRREMMALQFSTATGDKERARAAGERLFGLRLTTEVQLQLADYLHQSGMHDLAEGLLARARSRSGSRSSSLLALLQHYQTQGDSETAIEIAYQILRRSRGRSDNDGARQMAVQVLSQSGRLEELITRTKEQLERSPNSLTLHETLAEYYRASGDTENVTVILRKIAALRPGDATVQYGVAQKLVQAGDNDAACDYYLIALRERPSLLAQDYRSVQNAFQAAERTDDFVTFLKEVDLSQVGQYWYVVDLVQNLINNKPTRDQGLELFQRAWEAFPDYRSYLLGNIREEEVWQLPVMYDYARSAVIPDAEAPLPSPWWGTQEYSILQRLMQAAKSQDRLDPLFEEVSTTIEALPEWRGGEAVLAVIEANQGETDQAAARLTELMDSLKETIPLASRYQIGMTLRETDGLAECLIRWYEEGLHEYRPENWGQGTGPKLELADLYLKVDRRNAARATWLDLWATQDWSRYNLHNPGYAAYAKMANAVDLGGRLTNAKFPVDALRIYNEAQASPAEMLQARQYGGSRYFQQFSEGRKNAAAAVNAEALTEALSLWLQPRPAPAGNDEDPSDTEPGEDDPAADAPPTPVIDLLLTVQPDSIREARVTSVFESTIAAVAEDSAALEKVQASLTALQAEHGDDLSIAVLTALMAFANAGDPQGWTNATRELAAHVEQHPLDGPDQEHESASPADARPWLAVWLVAREGFRHEQTREPAAILAERALEAARRQPDDKWTLAMLREQAVDALEIGERETAEGRFLEMLEIILPPPSSDAETPERKNKFSRRETTQAVRGIGF